MPRTAKSTNNARMTTMQTRMTKTSMRWSLNGSTAIPSFPWEPQEVSIQRTREASASLRLLSTAKPSLAVEPSARTSDGIEQTDFASLSLSAMTSTVNFQEPSPPAAPPAARSETVCALCHTRNSMKDGGCYNCGSIYSVGLYNSTDIIKTTNMIMTNHLRDVWFNPYTRKQSVCSSKTRQNQLILLQTLKDMTI